MFERRDADIGKWFILCARWKWGQQHDGKASIIVLSMRFFSALSFTFNEYGGLCNMTYAIGSTSEHM